GHVGFTPKSGHSRIRSLPARSGNKAPDLCPAFVVLVWPYDGEPKFVLCSYHPIRRPLDPLAVKSTRYLPSFVSQSTSSTLWPSANEQQNPLRLATPANHRLRGERSHFSSRR